MTYIHCIDCLFHGEIQQISEESASEGIASVAMSTISEKAVITSLHELYGNKEEEASGDFSIISKEGAEFKVHSFLLICRYHKNVKAFYRSRTTGASAPHFF